MYHHDLDDGLMAMDLDGDYGVMPRTIHTYGKSTIENNIDNLPYSIFAKVASYLEPIWLYNLTHVNRGLRKMLSFEEGGNRIWYDSLPVAIWGEKELYQEEHELIEHVMELKKDGALDTGNTKQVGWIFAILRHYENRRQQNRHNNWFYHTARINAATLYQGHNQAQNALAGRWNAVLPRYMHEMAALREAEAPNFDGLRKKLTVLGGPYENTFNYKREIISRIVFATKRYPVRLDAEKRCQVCLKKEDRLFSERCLLQWGLSWCKTCFEKYTICYKDVTQIFGSDEICYHSELLVYNGSGKMAYFRPSLEQVLYNMDWPSISAVELMGKRMLLNTQTDLIQRSRLERVRRVYRLELVRLAEMMWLGYDPYPTETVNEKGETVTVRNKLTPDADAFKVFRDRFCPIERLGSMMFPMYRLFVDADVLEPINSGGWLEDPSMKKIRGDGGRVIDLSVNPQLEMFIEARDMLLALTNVKHNDYQSKGYGGNVVAWQFAATEYHRKRIEANIESGAIAQMKNIERRLEHIPLYTGIRDLRQKTGLANQDGTPVDLPLRRPNLASVEELGKPEWMRLDKEAVEMANKHNSKIATFNKIIREDCKMCPTGSGLFAPKGLTGLLAHMRSGHPEEFYEKDNWTIVG